MLISSYIYIYIFGDGQTEILTRHPNSDSLVPLTLFCFTLCNLIVFLHLPLSLPSLSSPPYPVCNRFHCLPH